MDVDKDQESLDFTRDWSFENAIDQKSLDSLELDLAPPPYSIPFGLPHHSRALSPDPKYPSLIGISFSLGDSPSGPRNVDQQGPPSAFDDAAPVDGLKISGSTSSFLDPGLPSMSTVDQEWERGMRTWPQGWGEGGMLTPDSSTFRGDLTLPFGVEEFVGDGGSKKRDREGMEKIHETFQSRGIERVSFATLENPHQ